MLEALGTAIFLWWEPIVMGGRVWAVKYWLFSVYYHIFNDSTCLPSLYGYNKELTKTATE
jgi:hypothetical protein